MIHRSVVPVAVALLLCSGFAQRASGTQPTHREFFDVKMTVEGEPVPGTPFRVIIRSQLTDAFLVPYCTTATIKYRTTGNIELIDASEVNHTVTLGQTMETAVTIRCAANDVASLQVVFDCGSGGPAVRWWFASDDSTVVMTKGYPGPRKPKADSQTRQKALLQSELRTDSVRYRELEASLQSLPLASRPPADTTEIDQWLYTPDFDLPMPPLPGVPILTRNEFFERKQAARADTAEVVWVEGTHLARLAGESLFVPLWPGSLEMGQGNVLRETLRRLPKNQEHSLVFYLFEGAPRTALEAICTQLVFLGKWWRFELYRGRTSFNRLPSMRQAGIGLWLDAFYPLPESSSVLSQDVALRERLLHDLGPQ